MGVVDIRKLKEGSAVVKAVGDITGANTAGAEDWVGKIERIVSGINQLLDLALKLKGQDTQQTPGFRVPTRRDSLTDHTPARRDMTPPKAIEQPRTPTEADVKKQEAVNKLVGTVEGFLEKCRSENPNMTASEMIARIPINVTQLSGLIALAKMQLNGGKEAENEDKSDG